jgi:hypothetical protein
MAPRLSGVAGHSDGFERVHGDTSRLLAGLLKRIIAARYAAILSWQMRIGGTQAYVESRMPRTAHAHSLLQTASSNRSNQEHNNERGYGLSP